MFYQRTSNTVLLISTQSQRKDFKKSPENSSMQKIHKFKLLFGRNNKIYSKTLIPLGLNCSTVRGETACRFS